MKIFSLKYYTSSSHRCPNLCVTKLTISFRRRFHMLLLYSSWDVSISSIYVWPGADPGFGQGWGGPASEAESCRCSEVESRKRSEHSAAGVQGPLKGPGSFWVFDAQICILTHSRDSFLLFLTSILTPKVDKNRALDFTSINLRHSDMLHLFFNLHEKVML